MGCTSHKLNLDVEQMITLNLSLKNCIDTIYHIMKSCRYKLCHRAMLRNLTKLEPIVSNKTGLSGKWLLLERFCRIFDSLRNVLLSQEPQIGNVLNPGFKTNAAKYLNQLEQIDRVTKYLQFESRSLADCRLALDTLDEIVRAKKYCWVEIMRM